MMKRILGNISVSAAILKISPATLYRLGTCLYMINRVSFVSVFVYQKFARAAFASLACDLGNFGNFTRPRLDGSTREYRYTVVER